MHMCMPVPQRADADAFHYPDSHGMQGLRDGTNIHTTLCNVGYVCISCTGSEACMRIWHGSNHAMSKCNYC